MLRIIINSFIALMIGAIGVAVYQQALEKPISLYYGTEVMHTSMDYSYKPGQHGTHYDFYITKNGQTEKLGIFTLIFIPTVFYASIITLIGLLRRVLTPVKVHIDGKVHNGPMKLFRMKSKKERSFRKFRIPFIFLLLTSFFFLAGYWGWWRI